ncbi:MAG: PQQ-binding-like beta-propeller repeat protein, partial [Woeseiaceae bacterium]|nr:PQQ-binding-like beta-propeller repeat protein [Woeseiaceae bacterium]
MNAQKRNIIGTCAGFLLALTTGAAAVADDTELLLATPPAAQDNKPNMLFILDTSGSMNTTEQTIAPYDYTQTYGGDCNSNNVYWTDVDVVPVCDGTNQSYIVKSSFHCQLAVNQMSGIGSFANTMVQYRGGGKTGTDTGPVRWQYLAPGYNTEPVECQADSGIHGDGRPAYLWASNGVDLADPFTNDPTSELSWGSAPANLAYIFYDGNYLNWKNSPNTVDLSRIDIVKAVVSAVLNSITGVNVGIMRFNNSDGGPVIKAMSDLDANRASVVSAIDTLSAGGWTPLAETLYESALYWRGIQAEYGEKINEHDTDPAALDSINPENYKQPKTNACSKNYNILLTDGLPTEDVDAQSLAPTLPNFSTALGRSTCDGTGDGMCLDDISEYLAKQDVDTILSGDQFVTTHTIGFTIDLDILRSTAERSGGTYFLADDVESLALTLLDIVADINERSLSFAAPTVSVNAFNRTQNLNDLYITVFSPKTKIHWPGNLKKYRVSNGEIVDALGLGAINPATGFFDDNAVSFWGSGAADGSVVTDGGAANVLPAPISRNLYTNNGADNNLTVANNALTPSNAAAFTLADFGLTGGAGEPTMDEMIRWLRGEDIADFDLDPATTVRNQMGDPLHSQPAAIVYGGVPDNPDVVVYAATNDGYLHAIDGETGIELWSFIPKELLGNMSSLFFDARSKYKRYGIDGNIVPVVADHNNNGIIDGTDFVYILFGMRRGGNTLFALDVTNKNTPRLLWNMSYPQFG